MPVVLLVPVVQRVLRVLMVAVAVLVHLVLILVPVVVAVVVKEQLRLLLVLRSDLVEMFLKCLFLAFLSSLYAVFSLGILVSFNEFQIISCK